MLRDTSRLFPGESRAATSMCSSRAAPGEPARQLPRRAHVTSPLVQTGAWLEQPKISPCVLGRKDCISCEPFFACGFLSSETKVVNERVNHRWRRGRRSWSLHQVSKTDSQPPERRISFVSSRFFGACLASLAIIPRSTSWQEEQSGTLAATLEAQDGIASFLFNSIASPLLADYLVFLFSSSSA